MVKLFKRMSLAIAVVGMVLAFSTSSAFAYGQCGSGTNSPNTWVLQLKQMGVLNQAANLLTKAGFHRMDGAVTPWVIQRVVAVNLAKPANPVDYGCHPGVVFSVGHRALPSGTPVFAVLPDQYAKSDISTRPRAGMKRILVCSSAAGKQNCTNPEVGTFCYYIWVPVVTHKHHKPRPKHKPKPKHCGCRIPPQKPPECMSPMTLVNGSCVNQTQTVSNDCKAGYVWNSNQQTCVTIQNNCGNVNTGSGSNNQGGNCNTNVCVSNSCNVTPPPPPPTPTCTAAQYGTFPNCKTVPTIYEINATQEAYPSESLKYYAKISGNYDSVSINEDMGQCNNSGVAASDLTISPDAVSNYCTAPSAVPSNDPLDPSVPAGYDKITWTVFYNGGQTITQPALVQIIPQGTPPF